MTVYRHYFTDPQGYQRHHDHATPAEAERAVAEQGGYAVATTSPQEAAMPDPTTTDQPTAPDGRVLCKGGCGLEAARAPRNDPRRGTTKGDPLPYAKGHHNRAVCQAAAKIQPSTQPASVPAAAPADPQPAPEIMPDYKYTEHVEALARLLGRSLPDPKAVTQAEADARELAQTLRRDQGWTLAELKHKFIPPFDRAWLDEVLEDIPAPTGKPAHPEPKAAPRTVSRFQAAQPKAKGTAKAGEQAPKGQGTRKPRKGGSDPQQPAATPSSERQGTGVPGRTLGYKPPLPDDAVRYIRRRYAETGGKNRPAIATEVAVNFGVPCNVQTVFKIGTRVSRRSVPDVAPEATKSSEQVASLQSYLHRFAREVPR